MIIQALSPATGQRVGSGGLAVRPGARLYGDLIAGFDEYPDHAGLGVRSLERTMPIKTQYQFLCGAPVVCLGGR